MHVVRPLIGTVPRYGLVCQYINFLALWLPGGERQPCSRIRRWSWKVQYRSEVRSEEHRIEAPLDLGWHARRSGPLGKIQ